MKKGKFIYGLTEEDRNNKLEELLQNYNSPLALEGLCFDPHNSFKYDIATKETDVIVVRECVPSFSYALLFNEITYGVRVNKKHERVFEIYPDFILTSDQAPPRNQSFLQRFEIIELGHQTRDNEYLFGNLHVQVMKGTNESNQPTILFFIEIDEITSASISLGFGSEEGRDRAIEETTVQDVANATRGLRQMIERVISSPSKTKGHAI